MDFKITTTQQEYLDTIFSGLLPHENFDSEDALELVSELRSFIRKSELYGIYYAMWQIMDNVRLIKLYRKGFVSVLTPQSFEDLLSIQLNDMIRRDNFSATEFFADYGTEYNLDIPAEFNEAVNFAYTKLTEKFNDWWEMAIPPKEAFTTLPILKESLMFEIGTLAVSLQANVLMNGIYYKRRSYKGFDDLLKFNRIIMEDISIRFMGESVQQRYIVDAIDSHEDSVKFDSENQSKVRNLYYLGFEPADDIFAIRTQDIISLIADEGVGKTRLMVDQAYKAIKAGCSILICCGETLKYKIKKSLECRHIWEKYSRQFTIEELDSPDLITEEDYDAKIEMCSMIKAAQIDLYENENYGKIKFVQSLLYETVETQLEDEWRKNPFDLVFIDHVGALDSDGSRVRGQFLSDSRKQIYELYRAEDRLVKELNIAFFNLSHTSSEATSAIRKGKSTGVRAGAESSATTKYASIVGLLTQPEDMKASDQVVLNILKARDQPGPANPMVLSRRGSTNAHEYHEKLQYLVHGEVVTNDDIESLIG